MDKHLIEVPSTVDECTLSTQTDDFADPPAPAEFIPAKTGIDAETQIEVEDNLFNFDVEVEPILNVIVSKTLEQALLEVEEEVEMNVIQSRLEVLYEDVQSEKRRENDLVIKAQEEYRVKHNAMALAVAQKQAELELKGKLLSKSSGAAMYSRVEAAAFETLKSQGVFYDPVQKQVKVEFFEWLYKEAGDRVIQKQDAKALLDDILNHSLSKNSIQSHKAFDAEGVIRISVHGKNLGVDVIGPIRVSGNETLAEIERVIQRWMRETVGEDCQPPPGGYLPLAYERE